MPGRRRLPPAARELAGLVHGWRALAADSPAGLDAWARRHRTCLAALETGRLTAAGGDGGINASNLLISQDRTVWLTGGAQPARGAACPAWTTTPPAVIISYAAAFAGYWARGSRPPAHPASPASAPARPAPPRPPSPGPPIAPAGPGPARAA